MEDYIFVICEKNGELLFNHKKVTILKALSEVSTLIELQSGTELIVNVDLETLKTEINSKNGN